MSVEEASYNAWWATLLMEELHRQGVEQIYLSPGSRSAPLAAAAARHPHLTVTVHLDERGSAYAALGWGVARGRPAVVLTTSGTAAALCYPAVIEAAQSGVPLLVLTADRPPELRDCGANQAIDQVHLYGRYPRWFFELPCPAATVDPALVLTTAAQAVARSRGPIPGPVHLNLMFREPLLPAPDSPRPPMPPQLAAWASSGRPFTECAGSEREVGGIDRLVEFLGEAQRGVLIAGALSSVAEREAVAVLAETLGWPLWPDLLSGLRLGTRLPNSVPYIDLVLQAVDPDVVSAPDAVLWVGGPLVSKPVQQWLAGLGTTRLATLHLPGGRRDPGHRVDLVVESDVTATCLRLAEMEIPNRLEDGWTSVWTERSTVAAAALAPLLEPDSELTEPGVARIMSRRLPPGHALLLGNSMPVRNMNTFAAADGPAGPVFGNRGASGIDGQVATACGLAAGVDTPLTALLGDLGTLHDLNALALVRKSPHPVTVVVINNDGGGIFHFLPVAGESDIFESCFGTPHGIGFEQAASLFGLPYHRVATHPELEQALQEAYAAGTSSLVEVVTDRSRHASLHQELCRRVAAALED